LQIGSRERTAVSGQSHRPDGECA